jgi:RNA polymerase sigma-70 factor (ECF subfamily)
MGELAAKAGPADVRLAAFVDAHYQRLVRLAFLICRNGPDAADAVQAGLERAWRGRETLREDTSLRAWVDRIVVREAIRLSSRHRSILSRFLAPRTAEAPAEPVDARAEAALAWTDMRTAFARLSADQRAVITLHLYAGYSVEETAAIVGAPIETVRSRLRLARDRLRRELGPER